MNDLTDATIFSKFYPVIFKKAVQKANLETMLKKAAPVDRQASGT